MAITSYEKTLPNGRKVTRYDVAAEGINRYTGRRTQKRRTDIQTKSSAERCYRVLWNLCREERPDGPPVRTWGDLLSRCLKNVESSIRSAENPEGISQKKYDTFKSRFSHLTSWNEKMLDAVTGSFVKGELDRLESSETISAPNSVEIFKAIGAVCAFAVQEKILVASPVFGMKRSRPGTQRVAPTRHEVIAILGEAKRRNHPYYFVWLLSVFLGLRRSELAGLKWTDIDFELCLAFIRRQNQPKEGVVDRLKGNKSRTVSIPKHLMPELKRYKMMSTSEFVISLDEKSWTGGHQAEVLRAFCEKIGVTPVCHHALRSAHITLALQDGVVLSGVKDNVGHAKLSTTDAYYREAGMHIQGVMDRFQLQVPEDKEGAVIELAPAR